MYGVTGRKPANNCCADNRNNTLIKKQYKIQRIVYMNSSFKLMSAFKFTMCMHLVYELANNVPAHSSFTFMLLTIPPAALTQPNQKKQ